MSKKDELLAGVVSWTFEAVLFIYSTKDNGFRNYVSLNIFHPNNC
jgi:hypothetical protein